MSDIRKPWALGYLYAYPSCGIWLFVTRAMAVEEGTAPGDCAWGGLRGPCAPEWTQLLLGWGSVHGVDACLMVLPWGKQVDGGLGMLKRR